MSSPPKSPFTLMIERATRRLEMFFRRSEERDAALFVDPGLDEVIVRIVKPWTIHKCFKKIFTYNTNKTKFDYEIITIFTTGESHHLKEYIDSLTNTTAPPKEIMIIFTNRFTYVARQFLEQHGFLHRFTYEELRLPLWILDPDLGTIEMKNSFLNVVSDGGRLAVEAATDAMKSIPVYEHFSNIFCIGKNAIDVGNNLPQNFQSGWSHILIFDRNVDLLSIFLSTFTYEAIVAEQVGIVYGIVRLQNDDTVLFSSDDSISSTTRLLTMPEATSQIKDLSTTIKEEFESFKKSEADIHGKSAMIKELANRVVLDNKSISLHLDLLEACTNKAFGEPAFHTVLNTELDFLLNKEANLDAVNECIALANDWRLPVRLLATYCLTTKIVPKIDEIRQNIIDKFGVEALAALWTLEEAGIIKEGRKNKWPHTRDKFKLYVEDVETGPGIVYSGYSPLFLRILEKIMKKQWSDVDVTLDELGIPHQVMGNRQPNIKRALVVFVGGSMYGEIAALRKNTSLGAAIDIITTDLLSVNKILSQFGGSA
ncbi:Sec1 family protein [Trichomonas vaginalis G3]|uniref:Sec1 family protein n=1 Tax=Trichomonas vaginalis (strain ATCC PRA-98 / G3) TaxID=412133 RepID=A2FJS2_TRIV3|nr:vesicle docking involved in exocytosis [Trichomonas vaginalis G3]EAX94854.1 Sec1 family protein [Trichomonas vaginalis G3]KAI5485703.1 vesicle docking involved in exocytosis [Trichomonas vaginalis G3]|eukprot:XP_001307784.1 Sec1 family protein [Trichomonas vaginalis G3]